MPNGNTLYAGRATGSIFAGRATPALMAGTAADVAAFPRGATMGWPSQGICSPIQQCCCKGPVMIAPGEVRSITLNWGTWIDSVPGYQVNKIDSLSLIDVSLTPPQPADPDIIKVVSGKGDDPDPPDNGDAADLAGLIPPYGTQVLIEVGATARIGAQYKLNICMIARDCDGRKIRQCDCVVITVAEC